MTALRRAGARCGIGLDNTSLNPSGDLFAEARSAQLVAAVAGDPLDATTVFRLLTSEGADAAGLGDEVGVLGPGRRADLLVPDTSGPHWHPRRMSWAETLIASATAADVRTVLVDGRVVVTGGAAVTGVALDRAAALIAGAMGWR